MDYNDKLRLAKEALDSGSYDKETIEYIFPELKEESEDEKIRKKLIKLLRNLFNNYSYFIKDPFYTECINWLEKQDEKKTIWHDKNEEPCEDRQVLICLSGNYYVDFYHKEDKRFYMFYKPKHYLHEIEKWAYIDDLLEKQGEQKPADKVESKFKDGQWIIFNGLTLYINEVVKGYYRTISKGGICNSYDWDIDNAARLWTIKEARDGDVLVCESGWTCIFKALVNDEIFGSYCFMDSTGWFCEIGSECHTSQEEFVKAYNGKIQPATKEQRDFLFQKMKEVGYKWNAEKKELIKFK